LGSFEWHPEMDMGAMAWPLVGHDTRQRILQQMKSPSLYGDVRGDTVGDFLSLVLDVSCFFLLLPPLGFAHD